jgi:HEAT repeat protein
MAFLSRLSRVILCVGLAALGACGPREPEVAEAPADPARDLATEGVQVAEGEAILAKWQDCVAEAQERMGDPACKEYAFLLAQVGGPPLQAALEQLDDPDVSPHGRVLIVDGFHSRLNHYASDVLKPMTASGDEMVRACATALLATIPDPELVPFLIPLTEDANPQVRFTALLGVAAGAPEDSPFRAQLKELYDAPSTQANMKEHIVSVFSKHPFASDAALLIAAIQDRELAPDVRRDAAVALGRVGDRTAIAPLLASLGEEASPEYRDAVELSVAVIKERTGPADETQVPIYVLTEPPDAPTE